MNAHAESSTAAAREYAACFVIDSSLPSQAYADLIKNDGVVSSLVGRLSDKAGPTGCVSCAAVFTANAGTWGTRERYSAPLPRHAFLPSAAFLASLPGQQSELLSVETSSKSRGGFAIAAWQNGFGSRSAKGKAKQSDLLEGIVAGLEMFHVYTPRLATNAVLDPMFPPSASSLQTLLDRDTSPTPVKYLIVVAPSSGSDGHHLRRNTRAEYDDLSWESLPDKMTEMDIACSGVVVNGVKQEQGAESPIKALLGKTASTRDPPWFQHDSSYELYLSRFAVSQPPPAVDPASLLPPAPFSAPPTDEARQRFLQIQALAMRNAQMNKSANSGPGIPDMANLSPAELQATLQRHQLAAMQKARDAQSKPSRIWTGNVTWQMSDPKNSSTKIETGVKVFASATGNFPPEDMMTHLWPPNLTISGIFPLSMLELEAYIKAHKLPCVAFSVPTELPPQEAAHNMQLYTQVTRNLHNKQQMGLVRFSQKDTGMILLPNQPKNAAPGESLRLVGVICLKTPLPQMANKPPGITPGVTSQPVNNYPQQQQQSQQQQQQQQIQQLQQAQQQQQIQQLQQAQLQAQQQLQRQTQPQHFTAQQQPSSFPQPQQMLQQQIAAAQRNITPTVPAPAPAPSSLPMGLSATHFAQLQAMIKNAQLPDVDPNLDLTTCGKDELQRLVQKIVERQAQQTAANQRQQVMQQQMQGQGQYQ